MELLKASDNEQSNVYKDLNRLTLYFCEPNVKKTTVVANL
jgi:hypothetical protein